MSNFDILKWKHNFQKLKLRHISLISVSQFNSKISTLSKFSDIKSDNFKLPITVHGRLITANTYKEKMYGDIVLTPEELKKTIEQWKGIKIYKSHNSWLGTAKGEHVPIDGVVGRIINTEWNEGDKAIDYIAEIYDRDIAYKIAKELIENVSVGFTKGVFWKEGLAFMKDVIPRELSLVFNPKDKQASIKAQNIEY